MKEQIIDNLNRIENQNDVTILFACESGSRAWGFDNIESDYDIRFVYKNNNIQNYLSLSDNRDVIEYMEDRLDIVGWDIKKALKLHYSSNPNLREWLKSPIKYIDWSEDIFNGLEEFDTAKLKYHYTNIATNNWKRLSHDDLDFTKREFKMFLHNCRCVLTWNVINQGDDPSINIFELMRQTENLNDDIIQDMNDLICSYRDNCLSELNFEVIENIKLWMETNLAIMRRDFPKTDDSRDFEKYNKRFFEIVLPKYEDYL